MSKIYEGDVGTSFDIETGVSLVTITSVGVEFRRPSGTEFTKLATVLCATVTDDNKTGVIRYSSTAGVIDEVGLWRGQALVHTPSGASVRGETFEFTVYPEFDLET